jgi:hypothetical protein
MAGGHLGGGTRSIDDGHGHGEATSAHGVQDGATPRGQDTDTHDGATYQRATDGPEPHRAVIADCGVPDAVRCAMDRSTRHTTGGNDVDLSKLSTGDKVIVGSALAYFIFMFLPWFEFDAGGLTGGLVTGGVDANGFDVGFLWGFFPLILALVMVAIVAVRAFSPDTELPELPFTYGQLLLGLGGLAALLVVLKLLIGEDLFNRQFGLFLAALAAIGLAAGGFLKMQEGEDAVAGGGGDPTTF